MHSERNKRMRFHEEGTSFYSAYRDGENVINYADGFPLNEFLSGLDKGKYGSVTKDFESLHAQRLEYESMLSRLWSSSSSPLASQGVKSSQPGFARSDQSHEQTQPKPKHMDIIDLDADVYVVPSVNQNPEKEEPSVINIDSDEEDGNHQPGIHSTCELKDPFDQLVLCGQDPASLIIDAAVVGERPHSLQYEKVLLRVSEPVMEYQKVVLNTRIEKEQTPVHLRKKEQTPVRLQKKVQIPLPLQKKEHTVVPCREKEEIPLLLRENEQSPLSLWKKEKIPLRLRKKEQIPSEKMDLTNKSEKQQKMDKKSSVGRDEKAKHLPNEVNGDSESAQRSVEMRELSPGEEIFNEDDGAEVPQVDGLEDLWNDMSLAMECSKDAILSDESATVQKDEECDHSYVLQEDFGLVCRVCGVIQRSIETIFDFQWKKATRAITYKSGSRHAKDVYEDILYSGPKFSEHNLFAADISIHPMHLKQMRTHQIEGFNFLVRNMVTDKPGGCILAHAPGSGKTFLLISFIQSFLAKLPDARTLVILPKGILATWKTEFQRWQVEDIPIYDFYSTKANSRAQQLTILSSWQEHKSILLLGYKQFSNIVTDIDEISSKCRDILLEVPSLLIMDEGHTPRNQETDVLKSLEKVQTPCKVVLSGTLFQNRVKEVFNIFNLVRPKFLMRESSIAVVRRIMSRIKISGRRPNGCAESSFYESVEETLQNDDNYMRKISLIKDLREMTQDVLHYYKGDILDELPGLYDFTVLLNLTPKQKEIVQKLGNLQRFKRTALENAVYMHPDLMDISDHATADKDSNATDEKLDNILEKTDARDGVKTKFFLKILSMSESAGEKVLVFSRYLVPLKFLEKLVMRTKGWRRGKEVFMILGDSSHEQRELSMEQFNNSPDAKVFFGSIKACGEGISLVGASRVLVLDIHLNPSVTRQAIGRAFRPGQKKKVYTYRLVAADSSEEEDHNTSFRKELMSKMWFEWSECCDQRAFELEQVCVADSQDTLLENSNLGADIKAMYKR